MRRSLLTLLTSLALVGCNSRSERAGGALLGSSQQAPALSGSGEWLAVVSDRRGRPTVQLRRLSDGSVVSVPQLTRHQPHSSPSLSWNGRYVAAITQRGRRRLAVVTDRLNGRMHPLPLPGGRDPVQLSLAPDAQQIALQVTDQGRWRVEMLDLSDLLEPDRPPGQSLSTPVLTSEP